MKPAFRALDINTKLEYWKTRLSNPTEFHLPTDFPHPQPPQYVDMKISFTPKRDPIGNAIGQLVDAEPVPEPARKIQQVVMAAFFILVHRYTGEEDIIIGSSSSNNIIPLRLLIKPDMSFLDVLTSVISIEEESRLYEANFGQVMEAVFPPDENTANHALPNLTRVRFFNKLEEAVTGKLQSSSFANDLTLIVEHGQLQNSTTGNRTAVRRELTNFSISFVYNQLLFSSQRINNMYSQLCAIFVQASDQPSISISQLSLVSELCQKVIPDPQADLNWGGFKGAIPHIFSKNAAAHPDRTCLVETALDGKERIFTYQQVHRASNLVAHYLIQKGVSRGDVVTMYAYRGCDLAVGVMGILKAGCVFNVIDPAYPTAQQEIYLKVAQPKALLLLKQAGNLLPPVRTYVQSNLSLKTELAELELLDDGTLTYIDGVVDPALQDKTPKIALGPDSIATLSFTYGSTDLPKGVQGRHFSLTHFYPWMSQEFNLTSSDRFTMLSGIAHDLIQRDLFTPFFLGASLHIPHPEIIGIPGRLAQWMSTSEVSVTHLTPAMGQLLVANVHEGQQIPTLRNAFFVGDILTKRDCTKLQHLAPNTNLINMYGTTETQRAVSYYRVPPINDHPAFLSSCKEILPAGQGMKDVQLLVVHRGSRQICGVGEVGEIYVRSSGLSEGYLMLEYATKEKFVANWLSRVVKKVGAGGKKPYYLGPRDRMYRTGDLGRYLPDGSVEFIGRSDDQVKIRGFRIELGEIDTHLVQHPRVRENITLVRRDRNEEQTLVTYFVPTKSSTHGESETDFISVNEEGAAVDSLAPRRYRKLIKELKGFLKDKLPSYSIPSIMVPLIKMPLNPNGNIDKPALPFPDTVLTSAINVSTADKRGKTPTETLLFKLWHEVLGHHNFTESDTFFDVGGHSILATRLIFQIRKELGVEVPLGLVFFTPTIRLMGKELDRIIALDINIDGLSNPEDNVGAGIGESEISGKNNQNGEPVVEDDFYYRDYLELVGQFDWKESVEMRKPHPTEPAFFLTGATGFLGSYILNKIMLFHPYSRVYCLVRANSDAEALERILANGRRYGFDMARHPRRNRIIGVAGDLCQPKLGISDDNYDTLIKEVDSIIHNGALVHWVYPYSKIRSANVLGTIEVLKLAQVYPGHFKPVHFISSTSVLDTPYYLQLSDFMVSSTTTQFKGVLETDDLMGSSKGLTTGYGQSKWVSEKLIMHAYQKYKYPASIVRSDYIMGQQDTGISVTDNFLWHLVKGCIQLKMFPEIDNVINMVPVDCVAGIACSLAFGFKAGLPLVYHATSTKDRCRFTLLSEVLKYYNFDITIVDYVKWRSVLMETTLNLDDKTNNPLFPLLHFVLDGLPTLSKAPFVDDSHIKHIKCIFEKHNVLLLNQELSRETIGRYLSYLNTVEFIPSPPQKIIGAKLPFLKLPNVWRAEQANQNFR